MVLGEWEMTSRGLHGLFKEMEDRTEAGFTVGEVSLAIHVLRLAIQRILNRTNNRIILTKQSGRPLKLKMVIRCRKK